MTYLSLARRVASATALTVLSATSYAQSNVIANGSFELGMASWSTNGFFLQGYDFGIDDDAQSGASAFYGGAVQNLGFLNQSFTTVVGQAYSVSFWLANDGYQPNQFQVLANGDVLMDIQNIAILPYTLYQTTFTARSAGSALQFAFRNDSGLLHLDNVAVTAVPEVSPALMLVIGLATMAVRRRTRRGL